MPLQHINNLESGISVRGKINDAIDQVNTNVTDIADNAVDIAQNTSNIANLQTSKQDNGAISTLHDDYDDSVTGDHTLLGTDTNKIYDITNSIATVFNLPATGGISAFKVGAKVTVMNNKSSTNNITLTGTGGASISPTNYSATLTPGDTAVVIRTGSNRYKRIL